MIMNPYESEKLRQRFCSDTGSNAKKEEYREYQ